MDGSGASSGCRVVGGVMGMGIVFVWVFRVFVCVPGVVYSVTVSWAGKWHVIFCGLLFFLPVFC